jgi:hypothetical protein
MQDSTEGQIRLTKGAPIRRPLSGSGTQSFTVSPLLRSLPSSSSPRDQSPSSSSSESPLPLFPASPAATASESDRDVPCGKRMSGPVVILTMPTPAQTIVRAQAVRQFLEAERERIECVRKARKKQQESQRYRDHAAQVVASEMGASRIPLNENTLPPEELEALGGPGELMVTPLEMVKPRLTCTKFKDSVVQGLVKDCGMSPFEALKLAESWSSRARGPESSSVGGGGETWFPRFKIQRRFGGGAKRKQVPDPDQGVREGHKRNVHGHVLDPDLHCSEWSFPAAGQAPLAGGQGREHWRNANDPPGPLVSPSPPRSAAPKGLPRLPLQAAAATPTKSMWSPRAVDPRWLALLRATPPSPVMNRLGLTSPVIARPISPQSPVLPRPSVHSPPYRRAAGAPPQLQLSIPPSPSGSTTMSVSGGTSPQGPASPSPGGGVEVGSAAAASFAAMSPH